MLLLTILSLQKIFDKLLISHDLIATLQLFIILIVVFEANSDISFSTKDIVIA